MRQDSHLRQPVWLSEFHEAARRMLDTTHTLVALRASSTRSFFSFSSVSVCAPTCTGTGALSIECTHNEVSSA